jgi:2-iminobutanoate/2-iminopropanoate deaminase
MARQIISPDTVHKPTTYYSHALAIDDMVYLAGQAPHDPAGTVWPASDPAGQVRHAFENMAEVLKAARAGFRDIVRMTVFVRHEDLLPLVWEEARRRLGDWRPAMTVAVVDGLAGKDYLLEVDAIAVRGG